MYNIFIMIYNICMYGHIYAWVFIYCIDIFRFLTETGDCLSLFQVISTVGHRLLSARILLMEFSYVNGN